MPNDSFASASFRRKARRLANDSVIKAGRWNFLSVDNVARFYGLGGDLTPVNKTIRPVNSLNQLEVTLESREAIVNGVLPRPRKGRTVISSRIARARRHPDERLTGFLAHFSIHPTGEFAVCRRVSEWD